VSTINCGSGLSCVNNRCVQCTSGAQCTATLPYCAASGFCVACLVDINCGTGLVCSAAGGCVQCNVDTDCAGNRAGPYCNTSTNTCVACLTDANCGDAGATCNTTTHTCTAAITPCYALRTAAGCNCSTFGALGEPAVEAQCVMAVTQNNVTECQALLATLQQLGARCP
jgi:hypothetical protein